MKTVSRLIIVALVSLLFNVSLVQSDELELATPTRAAKYFEAKFGFQLEPDATGAIVVKKVAEGRPAADAGLLKGDVIVEVEDESYDDALDLAKLLQKRGYMRSAALTIQRGDERLHLIVGDHARLLGMVLRKDTSLQARVVGVKATGAAKRAGLRQGDIIVSFDGREIKDYEDCLRTMVKHLKAATPGQRIEMTVMRNAKPVDIVLVRPRELDLPEVSPKNPPTATTTKPETSDDDSPNGSRTTLRGAVAVLRSVPLHHIVSGRPHLSFTRGRVLEGSLATPTNPNADYSLGLRMEKSVDAFWNNDDDAAKFNIENAPQKMFDDFRLQTTKVQVATNPRPSAGADVRETPIVGFASFTPARGGVTARIRVDGLTAGEYFATVHEYGDCGDLRAGSAGDVLLSRTHSVLRNGEMPKGVIGTVTLKHTGISTLYRHADGLDLQGRGSVVGRSLVIYRVTRSPAHTFEPVAAGAIGYGNPERWAKTR